MILERTHLERTDVNATIRRSIDIPGHEDRIKGHCERVQREYFDSGLFYDEMYQAQGGDMAELVGWELIDD